MGYGLAKGKHKISSKWWADRDVDLSVEKDGKQLTVGWTIQSDGTYDMIADWYSTGINQKNFVRDVSVGHTKHKASSWLRSKGYSVAYQTDEEGDLVVVGTRW